MGIKFRNSITLRLILLTLFIVLVFNITFADEQPIFIRDNLPNTNNELKLDDSFKTNLFTGSFMYSYGIEAPPGTNGLAPQITIFYASQKASASLLGTGWDFTQSYIERVINYTANDTRDDYYRLILNGNSYDLIDDGNRFRTQIETFLYIQNKTNATNEKGLYWTVTEKDGKQYKFGSVNSSEAVGDNGYASKWYLDTLTDTYNNSIFYSYQENPFSQDINATYLANISYNNDRKRLINFVYENSTRPDISKTYYQGNAVQYARRLQEIDIYVNSTFLRKYVFVYAISDAPTKTFLSNITLFGNDNSTALPPTLFSYYSVVSNMTNTSIWSPPICFAKDTGADQGVRVVDVNGDGLSDIIQSIGANCDAPSTQDAYINNGSGWAKDSKWYSPICLEASDPKDLGVRLADVNGDGLVDIIRARDEGNCDSPGSQRAYINNGSGWVSDPKWYPPVCFTDVNGKDSGTRLIDVNGDGLVDILRSVSTLGSTCNSPVTQKAYINNGSGWINDPKWYSPECFADSIGGYIGTVIADVNGDGLPDIIQSHGTPCNTMDSQAAYVNNGSGWVSDSKWKPPICMIGSNAQDFGIRVEDVNGDGLPDIVQGMANTTCEPPTDKKAYINNGTGWVDNSSWAPPYCFTDNTGKDLGVRILDVSGDGIPEIIRSTGSTCSSPDTRKVYANYGNQTYLLKSVRNSLGGSLIIGYNRSTYLNNTGNDSMSDLGFNLWVASSIMQVNGMNGTANITSTYNYNYSGGLYDYKEKSFRGFAIAQETRPDGANTSHYFHQDNARTGREYKTEKYSSGGVLLQRKEFVWNFTKNGTYFVTELRLENTTAIEGDTEGFRTAGTSYVYDAYGNIKEKYSLGDADATGDEKNKTIDYVYNTTAWIVDKPIGYRLLNSTGALLKRTNYTYDGASVPSKGSVTSKSEYITVSANATTSYSYDSFGNNINVTDPVSHTTSYAYNVTDTTFTFPERKINAKGQNTQYTYDAGSGKLISAADANGFVINYTYDVFGRLSSIIKPYDSTAYPTKKYVYETDSKNPAKIKTSDREDASTNRTFDSYQFMDGFGNVLLSKKEAENAKQIATSTMYDGILRAGTKSNPHFVDFADNYSSFDPGAGKTNITYDSLDRITGIENPDHTKKTFTYGKWTTTVFDENGNQKKNVMDAYGRITSVFEYTTEEAYNTSYQYDAAGNLLNIIDNEKNNFTFAYDGLGRKIFMTDPDMGTWNYTYDAAGNLIQQKDNRNITTDFTYDEINRLTKRNSSAESFSFTYDMGANGTLSTVQGTNYTINYTYDSRLRKASESRTVGNQTIIFNYTYDSLDRVKVKFFSGMNITYNYTDQNTIQSIDGILSNADYNELNGIAIRNYNNSLTSNFTYDPASIRLARIITGNIQDVSYTYDNASNIIRMTDIINLRLYRMTYDALNRLNFTRRTDNGTMSFVFNYTYTSTGKMKSIVTSQETISYNYSPNPVHAPNAVTRGNLLLQQPNITQPNGGETAHQNVTIRWTQSNGANGEPVKYDLDYNNGTWNNIVTGFGFADSLNDTSKIKNIVFNETKNITVFVEMPRINKTYGTLELAGVYSNGSYPKDSYLEIGDPDGVYEWNYTTRSGILPDIPSYPDVNVIALYRFSEGSGNTTVDATGIYNASLKSDTEPLWTANGYSGNAVQFDGVNDNIIQSGLLDNITENGTIEFWFNPTITLNSTTVQYHTFMRKLNGGAFTIQFLANDGRIVFNNYDGASHEVFTSIRTWYAGVWYHIAATWGKTGTFIYVNGVRQGNHTFTGKPENGHLTGTYIGSSDNGYEYKGMMDEFAVYNIQKTAFTSFPTTEITQDFSAKLNSIGCSCTNCVQTANTCTVPFQFHSETNGTIRIWSVYITTNATSYDWNTTAIAAGNYTVRVRAREGLLNSTYDQSDGNFTIS